MKFTVASVKGFANQVGWVGVDLNDLNSWSKELFVNTRTYLIFTVDTKVKNRPLIKDIVLSKSPGNLEATPNQLMCAPTERVAGIADDERPDVVRKMESRLVWLCKTDAFDVVGVGVAVAGHRVGGIVAVIGIVHL